MNKDTLEGDWNLVKGKIKEQWGKLTDDDIAQIKGKRDQLLGTIQKKYGIAKDKAEKELTDWEKRFSHDHGDRVENKGQQDFNRKKKH